MSADWVKGARLHARNDARGALEIKGTLRQPNTTIITPNTCLRNITWRDAGPVCCSTLLASTGCTHEFTDSLLIVRTYLCKIAATARQWHTGVTAWEGIHISLPQVTAMSLTVHHCVTAQHQPLLASHCKPLPPSKGSPQMAPSLLLLFAGRQWFVDPSLTLHGKCGMSQGQHNDSRQSKLTDTASLPPPSSHWYNNALTSNTANALHQ
jgi:hypothetical protein